MPPLQCKVQDFRPDGERESLQFRIISKSRGVPVVNDHEFIVLKAETLEKKYEWMARLRAASVPPAESLNKVVELPKPSKM